MKYPSIISLPFKSFLYSALSPPHIPSLLFFFLLKPSAILPLFYNLEFNSLISSSIKLFDRYIATMGHPLGQSAILEDSRNKVPILCLSLKPVDRQIDTLKDEEQKNPDKAVRRCRASRPSEQRGKVIIPQILLSNLSIS